VDEWRPSRNVIEIIKELQREGIQASALGIFNKITPQYRLPLLLVSGLCQAKEFNCNIEVLAKWIEGAIRRVRSGVKNSRVIEVHNTCHYVFIVDEAFVVRETRKLLLED